MKNTSRNLFCGLLSSFAFLACLTACQSTNPAAGTTPGPTSPALEGDMRGFKDNLSQLLPLVIDSHQFNAPENRDFIDREVKNLLSISKQVVHNPQVQNSDPSLRFISTAFSEDLKRAKESLDENKREFARYTLLNVTAYCIECHTRTGSGPSFNSPILQKTLKSLNPMEKGEYLLSTREYGLAYNEFEKVIKNSLASQGNLFDLDRAVRYALSIAVKFQNDPRKSLEIAQLIEKSNRAPLYLRESAKSWDKSIQFWKKEKFKKNPKVDDVLKHSEFLVKEGRALQSGLSERGGDIYFLRGLSQLLSLLSRKDLTKEQTGEALYLTGESYEAVRDLSMWSLHENYYEACIREVPHTPWSEKCYTRLEESIYFGYTGSSGLGLPADVQQKLDDFKKEAVIDRK